MPSARSLPALICAATPGMASNMICTWPPSTCVCASELPLNGTWFRCAPEAERSISIARWLAEPLPDEA